MVDSKEAEIEKQFKAAQDIISKGGKEGPKLSNNEKLVFYGLYKQATVGKCNIKAPGRLDVVARAKYDAWNALGNMSQTEARQKFLKEFQSKMPAAKL